MRVGVLVLSLLVTLSVAAVALTYLPGYVGQHRIYVQSYRDSSRDHKPYHSYGYLRDTNPDTARAGIGNRDPYRQRYYSESEGWTYYTLPSYSSARQSDDH
jgi:hypothetical protein